MLTVKLTVVPYFSSSLSFNIYIQSTGLKNKKRTKMGQSKKNHIISPVSLNKISSWIMLLISLIHKILEGKLKVRMGNQFYAEFKEELPYKLFKVLPNKFSQPVFGYFLT